MVQVRSNGILDATDNSTVVTASIANGTGTAGAILSGTTTATAVAGVATFTNLSVNAAGTNYQLRFTATGVTEASSGEAAAGITRAALDTGIPVIFGVLTVDTRQQALDRIGGKEGHKGEEAALTAIEMVSLLRSIPE